ncbi:toxin YhaV [Desulfomicrobium apsheronum]|uniref:Toxin YhaV n=1 Tax=Desulfomicrobium apsheronum TaxID=52560 RepID=A0A1I3N9A6_9BACT|nr:type II toxin-antitoxin system YhaV family toxin [Desulfomicrobium apsheronum]SFJ05883.1 toxin YhaV [Desulfomicrobium apsheronum]
MIENHGRKLFFHECMLEQMERLEAAAVRARRSDPEGYASNANVKLFTAVSRLVSETIPSDPSRPEYRLGMTMGAAFRHWRRAKIGRRFRVFFRYDSASRVIVFVWINDEQTLRCAGGRSDPYVVFGKMLSRGHPPDEWNALLAASKSEER